MLNPNKCVFGVFALKYLGFIVFERGIETDPEKIKAIKDMLAPKNMRDVQQLSGYLVYLGWFLAHMREKSLPFYQLLMGGTTFIWTPVCQRAFDQFKEYLSSTPLLVNPVEGETLFMYLAVTEIVVCSILCSSWKKKWWLLVRESCTSSDKSSA